jgi:hypothetical protein
LQSQQEPQRYHFEILFRYFCFKKQKHQKDKKSIWRNGRGSTAEEKRVQSTKMHDRTTKQLFPTNKRSSEYYSRLFSIFYVPVSVQTLLADQARCPDELFLGAGENWWVLSKKVFKINKNCYYKISTCADSQFCFRTFFMWQMEATRAAARSLVLEGLVEITQKGRVVDPFSFKGPIRLRLKVNDKSEQSK